MTSCSSFGRSEKAQALIWRKKKQKDMRDVAMQWPFWEGQRQSSLDAQGQSHVESSDEEVFF